jgi:serine/threonine protein kinase
LKQINNEEKIMTKLPHSEYIVKLNKILKDKDRDITIFEYENFGENLRKYLKENCGGLGKDKNNFINIVKALVNALVIIHENGAMHRNINPDNINISIDEQTQKVKLVKLGGFD